MIKKPVSSVLTLILVSLALTGPASSARERRDWENPAVFERNQEEAHVPLMPFETIAEALANDRKASRYCHLLNGSWKFHWAPVPEEAPTGFHRPDFNVSEWDDIRVPGNWQLQGFGHPLFRNISQPFPSTPPYVPTGYNPVGSYRHTFTVPASWKDRQIFLHFEGVQSASYVWVNGHQVGYNQGGMEPAEFDVTDRLTHGVNTIAVQVYRFSDGTYLEDQDMWRLSGIYRDVYLMATPKVHIRDFAITTDLDTEYRDAELSIHAEVKRYGSETVDGYRIRATLYDGASPVPTVPLTSQTFSVPGGGTTEVAMSVTVTAPKLWSAEQPNLYGLTLELLRPDGSVGEILGSKVGFREVEVKDQAILINGKPVKLNAVNSHVHHPDTGRTMDVATMRQDLVLMKRFNINCVRTSHYPPNVEYLDLADELGVYVVDETGDEAHSTPYLSERSEWRAAYLDRARKMVRRDRNHPSVVIWSAGNESGSGNNICALIAEGKRLDPSRPAWLYGGNNDYFPANQPLDCEDIVGPRYPIPFELKTRIGQVPASVDPRPSFMDEYLAATGNSLGGLDEFWEVIYAHRRCTGGAVWDWVSPGIRWRWTATPDASPYGNDGVLMGRAKLVKGRFGRALALSGHDEWVELYRDPSLDITGNQLTLEAWVFPRTWNGTGPFITKGDHQYGLQQISRDELEFYIHDRKRISVEAKTPEGWQQSWHHLAGVYDGSELRLYVDRVLRGSVTHSGDIDHNPFPVNIGRNAAVHGQEHPGELCNAIVDAIRIYARALRPEELAAGEASLKQEAVLWLDFESVEDRGEFFSLGIGGRSYGLVWPDRMPQPELWQLKKSAQPVELRPIDLATGRIRVFNRHQFTNLAELGAAWQLTEDGTVLQEGPLELDLPPLQKQSIRIPFERPEPKPGARYRLLVRFFLREATAWAEQGHEIAWEQFELPWETAVAPTVTLDGLPPISLAETEQRLTVRGEGFTYIFDKITGELSSLQFRGVEMIERGPTVSLWRPPLANERDAWGLYRGKLATHRDGMGNDIANGWRSIGLDRLQQQVESFSARQTGDAEVKVEVRAHAVSDRVPADAFASGFDLEYSYRLLGSGDIVLRHTLTPHGAMPEWLPRVGLQMVMRQEFDRLEWYGRGPQETYPDRKTGAKIGIYAGSVEEQYEPYLVPQDHGNKSDVHWVSLSNAAGVGLFVSGRELLNVSAQHYGTDNLSRACYPFQLTPQAGITLNIDHRTSGVGGTAISVLNPYRVLPQVYQYTIRLKPYATSEAEPELLFRERLPR